MDCNMMIIGKWEVIFNSQVTMNGIVLQDGRHYTLRTKDELDCIDPDREVLLVFGECAYFGLTDGKVDSQGILHFIVPQYHILDCHGMATFEGWQYTDEVFCSNYNF